MTKHSETCQRAWSRYDATCQRCQELASGAPARKGWNGRAADDARRVAEIRAHDCAKSHCGPVCTFGDY